MYLTPVVGAVKGFPMSLLQEEMPAATRAILRLLT